MFISFVLLFIFSEYFSPRGKRQTNSFVFSADDKIFSDNLSLLENRPALSFPRAIIIAPVSVAKSIIAFGLKLLFA